MIPDISQKMLAQPLRHGIRIGSASAGLAMFHDLPIEQIHRVEMVGGPRSSLYGSKAIGGVIQKTGSRWDRGAHAVPTGTTKNTA